MILQMKSEANIEDLRTSLIRWIEKSDDTEALLKLRELQMALELQESGLTTSQVSDVLSGLRDVWNGSTLTSDELWRSLDGKERSQH